MTDKKKSGILLKKNITEIKKYLFVYVPLKYKIQQLSD